MSRLIVKNLPTTITAEKLREIFSQKGLVTDVQLKYTKDGKFRHFAFVGFKTKEEAQNAMEYFDNTCIKTCRIVVQVCAGLGDVNKPKAWSKYAPDSSAYQKAHRETKEDTEPNGNKDKRSKEKEIEETKPKKEKKKNKLVQETLDKYKEDPLFLEFMEAHGKGQKGIWSNDLLINEESKKVDAESKSSSDEEEYQDVDSGHESDETSSESENEVQEDNAAKKEISDLEYLKLKTVKEGVDVDEEEDKTKTKEKKDKKKEKSKPKGVVDIDGEDDDDDDDEDEPKTKEKKDKKKEKSKPKGEVDVDGGDDDDEEEEEDEDEPKMKEKKDQKKEKKSKPFVKMFTVKMKGLSSKLKRKDIKQFFHPLKPKSVRLPPKYCGIAFVGFASEYEMKKALMKNFSFIAGKRITVLRYEDKKDFYSNREGKEYKWKDQEEGLKNEETIAESGRIFVRNLAYTVTEEEIEKLFTKYGEVTEVVLPVDRNTRKIKGYAAITYLIPEHAAKAYMELDGSVFHGRMLHLLPGKTKPTLEELLAQEGLTYTQKQILKKKAEAASSHNWNTLFLGQNAVADLIAETYNTTKDKVLDSSGSESIAVRMALGETQIVTKMRQFLEKNDVQLDAFNQAPKQRSKTVILAKNLPAKTTTAEITQMFMKFGEIGRVVLPPSGVTAIVEFLEPFEAKAAFMKLAYTKFKHLPLYLEWAPSDTFKTLASKTKSVKEETEKKEGDENEETEVKVEEDAEKSSGEDEEDESPEPNTTLFIKNLNFETDEKQVHAHFEKCGPIHEVIVAKKKDPKNPGKFLSMGYGFIQFKRKESAEKALKTLQHSLLNDHALELKRSNRTSNTEVVSSSKKAKIGKQTGTKILVRNVPFQATRKEVIDLFKTFGEIKDLRLPKKMVGTGSHRGFAFVDYYTKHDAKRAFKALCQSTHLYGRRLVLEWASSEDNINDIRKRTTEEFGEGPLHKTLKKSEISVDSEGDDD